MMFNIRQKVLLQSTLYSIIIWCWLFLPTGARAENAQLLLAKGGKTSYVIALANDAVPAEKTAAVQLQKYLQQITGAPFRLCGESEIDANAPQILVGAGARVKVLLPGQNWDSLHHDGIVIKTVGNKLILAGGRPRGTLYAVFQFLEDVAGCRWWTPTEKDIPHKSTFNIPPQNTVYIPPFRYRENLTTPMEDSFFATVLKENGHSMHQSVDWGSHYTILGWCHTFSQLLPQQKYFHDHPEWYSDPRNHNLPCTANSIMPTDRETQLCVSNPEVQNELARQALLWIQKNPQAGYISISENDNGNFCRCPACEKLTRQEGSPMGPILQCVNNVAQKIHQQYPDFMVETLAYYDSVKPPKTIRPAPNVLIRLAPIFDDFGHPMNSKWNEKTRKNLRQWSKIAPNLFVWNYVTNFHYGILPHPNWDVLAEDLRFFAANHVQGVFEQGNNFTKGAGDFVPLRAWLIGHLMWNPNLDQQQLMQEFLQGYYGAAAPCLEQYIQLLQHSFLSQDRRLTFNNTDFSFLTLDFMNQAERLFDQAEKNVQGEKVLLARVQRERLAVDAGWIYRYHDLKNIAAKTHQQFLGPDDFGVAVEEFIQKAQVAGVQNYGENKPLSRLIPQLRELAR